MLLPLAFLAALHAAPAAAFAADSLTGSWRITGDVADNPVNELCTFRQAGAKLTGTCKNTDAANARAFDVAGEVKDGKVTFTHGVDYQGQVVTLTYTSTTASAKELKGTIDVPQYGVTGTFTAAPAAPALAAAAPTASAPAASARP